MPLNELPIFVSNCVPAKYQESKAVFLDALSDCNLIIKDNVGISALDVL
jgi:hypothetical protein